jgi:hypothetical protein
MAIQSSGEFEIITSTILMRVTSRLAGEPSNGRLVTAKKGMEEGLAWVVQRKKPDANELKRFGDAAEVVRQAYRQDTALSDQLFDLLDFLEYRT